MKFRLIEEKKNKLNESLSKSKIERDLKNLLVDYLVKLGYEDADEYVVAEVEETTNFEGEPCIKMELRNDLIGWYELDDDFVNKLNAYVEKFHKDSYFEPDYDTVWNAYVWDNSLQESKENKKTLDLDEALGIKESAESNEVLSRDNIDTIRPGDVLVSKSDAWVVSLISKEGFAERPSYSITIRNVEDGRPVYSQRGSSLYGLKIERAKDTQREIDPKYITGKGLIDNTYKRERKVVEHKEESLEENSNSQRTLMFTQIADSRFDKDLEKTINQYKSDIISKLSEVDGVKVHTDKIRDVEFEDGTKQLRQDYFVQKQNNKISWNDIYAIINSVNARPYKFIKNFVMPTNESLKEDTIKQNGKWVNKGKEGTHGTFKTKKAADAQRKAMFANSGKNRNFGESVNDKARGVMIVMLDGDYAFFFDEEAEKLSDILTLQKREFSDKLKNKYKVEPGVHTYTTIPATKLSEYKDRVEIVDKLEESYDGVDFRVFQTSEFKDLANKCGIHTIEDLIEFTKRINKYDNIIDAMKDYIKENGAVNESLNESQSQEIAQAYRDLSKEYGVDVNELVYGKDGFMQQKYPNGLPDFKGDIIYSEKYWTEFEDWCKEKGIEIKEKVEEKLIQDKLVQKKNESYYEIDDFPIEEEIWVKDKNGKIITKYNEKEDFLFFHQFEDQEVVDEIISSFGDEIVIEKVHFNQDNLPEETETLYDFEEDTLAENEFETPWGGIETREVPWDYTKEDNFDEEYIEYDSKVIDDLDEDLNVNANVDNGNTQVNVTTNDAQVNITANEKEDEEFVDIFDNSVHPEDIVADDIENAEVVEDDLSDDHIEELAKKAIEENLKHKKPLSETKTVSTTTPLNEDVIANQAVELNQSEEEVALDYVSPNAVDANFQAQEVDLNNI